MTDSKTPSVNSKDTSDYQKRKISDHYKISSVEPSRFLSADLLAQLNASLIDIRITKSIGILSPRAAAKSVWVGTDTKIIHMANQSDGTSTDDYVRWYFSKIGVDQDNQSWLPVKKNIYGRYVVVDQLHSLINNTHGFMYTDNNSDDIAETFQLELQKYDAWENGEIFDVELSYRNNHEFCEVIKAIPYIGSKLEDAVEKAKIDFVAALRDETCNLQLVIGCKRDDIPNGETPLEYLKSTFLDFHGTELAINRYSYSIARKEITVTLDPKTLANVQAVYDKTESGLLIYIREYLEDYNIDGWDVLRVFMSGVPLAQWDGHILGAWFYALFKELDNLNDPRVSFKVA